MSLKTRPAAPSFPRAKEEEHENQGAHDGGRHGDDVEDRDHPGNGSNRLESSEFSTSTAIARPQYVGCKGRRLAMRKTVSTPKAKPPMCAKTATPPVWSGCVSPTPPCHTCRAIQIPRNQIAGISRKKMKPKKIAVNTRARGSRRK